MHGGGVASGGGVGPHGDDSDIQDNIEVCSPLFHFLQPKLSL